MSKKGRKVLALREDQKAKRMKDEEVNGYWICGLSGHFMTRDQVVLAEKRCRGMRGDGNDPENQFLACFIGNNSQGSVHYDVYMELPLAERQRRCGVSV